MPAPFLLEAWSFRASGLGTTTVMPDGCQDLLCITDAQGRSEWRIAPLADGAYTVTSRPGDHYRGWRLRPGVALDAPALLRAVGGRAGNFDPLDVLGTAVCVRAGVADALQALAERASVRLAAASLGVAERSLSRQVAQATGRPPAYWRRLARARRAAQALASEAPLADIAADHGYADQAHFSREMRRWFAATPQALRRDAEALAALTLLGY